MGSPALILSQIVPVNSLKYPLSWNSYFNHLSSPQFLRNKFYINWPPHSFQLIHSLPPRKRDEAQISYNNYYLNYQPSILFTHRTRGPSNSRSRWHCPALAWGPFFSSSPRGPNTPKSPSGGSNPTAPKSADNPGGTWPRAYGKLSTPETKLEPRDSCQHRYRTPDLPILLELGTLFLHPHWGHCISPSSSEILV